MLNVSGNFMKLFSTFVLICIFSNICAQDDDIPTRIHKRDSVTQLLSENYLRNTLGTKFFNNNLKFEKNYGQFVMFSVINRNQDTTKYLIACVFSPRMAFDTLRSSITKAEIRKYKKRKFTSKLWMSEDAALNIVYSKYPNLKGENYRVTMIGQENGIRYNFMFGIGKSRGVCYDVDPTTGEIEITHWITS